MTNENEAPERIWARPDYNECWVKRGEEEDIEYTRADLSDAKDKRIAELEAKLHLYEGRREAVDFINALDRIAELTEALEYYNVAGYEGKEARAALAQTNGETDDQ